jgi:hypothetical protein
MLRNQKPQEITEVLDLSQSDGQLRRAEASRDLRETAGQHDLPSMDHGVSEQSSPCEAGLRYPLRIHFIKILTLF